MAHWTCGSGALALLRFLRFVCSDAMASPSSSPDPSLVDSTNVRLLGTRTLPACLPTPPSERKRASHTELKGPERKRVKLEWPQKGKENVTADVYSESESEEEVDLSGSREIAARYSVYNLRNRAMLGGPSSSSRRLDRELHPSSVFATTNHIHSTYAICLAELRVVEQVRHIQVSFDTREPDNQYPIRVLIFKR